ncbi:MAG: glycosyltransferase family 1 protein [Chloroflexi bacterium]|nr:glycosyltransferase family 1 protein [Chloroflexota bacterium]
MAIRVLHVLGGMNRGGVETMLIGLLKRVDRDAFAMDFCCLSGERGPRAPEVEALGSRVLPLRLDTNLWAFSRRFRALLREGRYDVVHSHVQCFSGYILRLAGRAGVPARVAHSHSTSGGRGESPPRRLYRRVMRRWIGRYATAGLAVSAQSAAALYGDAWRRDLRYCVVYPGIDLSPFDRDVDGAALRRALGIPADARVIGHVARFVPEKNHLFLLEMAREAFARAPEVWLLLVGDGPLRPGVERRVRELGMASRVTFAGARSDVPDLLLGAVDLFCLPSRSEGLPVAAVEAQAAGLPCVLSSAITAEAAIVPGAVDLLPLEAGAAAWAERITRRLGEPRIPRSEALAALRAGGFDVDSAVATTCQTYRSAWGARGEAGSRGGEHGH